MSAEAPWSQLPPVGCLSRAFLFLQMYTVYLIENAANNKIYVGITSKTLEQRLNKHFIDARYGEERALQRAIRKHGEEAFEIHPLQDAEDREKAFELEKHWIELLNTYKGSYGYNGTPGGDKGPVLTGEDNPWYGKSFSEDTLQEIAEGARKGGKNSPSEEAKEKMSEAHSGENAFKAKLTRREAGEIKWLYNNTNKSQTDLAEQYSVTISTIGHIGRGETWTDTPKINPDEKHSLDRN